MDQPRPSVAIIGRPNVGKSALFNRLVGRKIAIVHDQPGITRDRLSGVCTRGERKFTVFDTGGIAGAGESELLREVERVVSETIQASDVLVFAVDGRSGLSPLDYQIAKLVRKSRRPVILAINKIDHDKQEDLAVEFDSLGFERAVPISAEHNRGITDLLENISKVLPNAEDQKPETGDPQSTATRRPLPIAILGRPNVGKSSLINAIVRDERAIVSEIAGTTRDAIDVVYERNDEQFVFIDTAGMRRRSRHSTSVEVFSVMRAERTIQRAELCILTVDVSAGVTAQDKRIAGLIQEEHKACAVVLNKWDLIKPSSHSKRSIVTKKARGRSPTAVVGAIDAARENLFFLDYAPVVVASAKTGENVDRLFGVIQKIRAAAKRRIGTGVLNRVLRAAIAANPPPMRKGKRLKLLYGAQSAGSESPDRIVPPEFVLFVNDAQLMTDNYKRYLQSRLREIEPFPGLPVILTLRPRRQ